MLPFAGSTSIRGKPLTRKFPVILPLLKPGGVASATRIGFVKVVPPSTDLTNMIPDGPGPKLNHAIYNSPLGPTAGCEPEAAAPPAGETATGAVNVSPPSVDCEKRITPENTSDDESSKLV